MFAGKNLMNLDSFKRELIQTEGKIVLVTLDVKKSQKMKEAGENSQNSDAFVILFAQDIELLTEHSANEFKDISNVRKEHMTSSSPVERYSL